MITINRSRIIGEIDIPVARRFVVSILKRAFGIGIPPPLVVISRKL
jgi:hypothetical protein